MMFWDFPNLVLEALCLVLFLAGKDGREGLAMPCGRNVRCGAGDLHLRPPQGKGNELLVNWREILAPGRLLGSLITD